MAEISTEYVKLAEDIFVPSKWSLSDIEDLVLALAKKIIDKNNSISSILQVNDIPAKLVIRKSKDDSVYVFEEVSTVEEVGAFLYEIVLPKEKASIRRRTLSGNNLSNQSWPDYAISVSTKTNKISYYLTPPRLDSKTLFGREDNISASRRHSPIIKRSKMAEYFALKNITISTGAHLNISSSQLTYAKIHSIRSIPTPRSVMNVSCVVSEATTTLGTKKLV